MNKTIPCPIVTGCDLCLLKGNESVAVVRTISSDYPEVIEILSSGLPNIAEVHYEGTYVDLCENHRDSPVFVVV